MNTHLSHPTTLEDFSAKIKHEFCIGSAIAPSLYRANVKICSDLEYSIDREPSTPIHDALNWHYSRFGHQAKQSFFAALLLNESGDCWQAKLSQPRQDTKGKIIKYETPIGHGARLYLPSIPKDIRQRISQRYNVDIPAQGSFWSWLAQHPEIPRIWTEGGKKALALLSQGYVGLALLGVNGGYRKVAGLPALIPDTLQFTGEGTTHLLAFDADEKVKTIYRVNAALSRFGKLLKNAHGDVSVVHWKPSSGKGIDDVIVQSGEPTLHSLIGQALSLEDWQRWQWLEYRLAHSATVQTNTVDLSSLDTERFPKRGIIAIAAAKGTGKTKLQGKLLEDEIGGLALSHRITLCRNLCERMGLDYRGDIQSKKSRNQVGIIDDGVYRIGVGSCVDALLSIQPEWFINRDLFIDEVVQVVRHLLTSSTCAKDGKRPALLARFHEFVRVARRVIVADADLNSATLDYLQTLRADSSPVFLIRNDYQPEGYPVLFLEAPDKTEITARILQDAESLESGQVLLIATDSKRSSKMLHQLLIQQNPHHRILLINSETSSGLNERQFIQTPDTTLEEGTYNIVIVSPSMATGVSIEVQNIVQKVYGVFSGVSSTDADMAQALGRVRQPVERIVWCNRVGSNYSKVSRSTHAPTLKNQLKQSTAATVSLVRSSLREDDLVHIENYDWENDPHLNLFVKIEAERNRAMTALRDALRIRLIHEGNSVTIHQSAQNKSIKELLKNARDTLKTLEAEAIANAQDLSLEQRLTLETKEVLSQDERHQLQKAQIRDFYALNTVTVENVLFDANKRRQREITGLENLLYPQQAIEKTAKSVFRQTEWGKGVIPWDIASLECQRWLREFLGLKQFLDPNKTWTKVDLEDCALQIRKRTNEVRLGLNFTVADHLSDVQIVHQLLSQMGIKITFQWSRSIPGLEGHKEKIYRLDMDHWDVLSKIIERRQQRRNECPEEHDLFPGSPPTLGNHLKEGGDPKMGETRAVLPDARSPVFVQNEKLHGDRETPLSQAPNNLKEDEE